MSEIDWLQRLRLRTDQKFQKSKNYARYAQILKPIEATENKAVFELEVTDEIINGKGTLHGGQIALLVDMVTALSIALSLTDTPIVSVELSCSYLLPAMLGEKVRVEAECIKLGRNVIFTEAAFIRSDGCLIAKGKHTLSRLNHLKQPDGSVVAQ